MNLEEKKTVEIKHAKSRDGYITTVHKGNDFSVIVHPKDMKKIVNLDVKKTMNIKDETGTTWTVERGGPKGDIIGFRARGMVVSVDRDELRTQPGGKVLPEANNARKTEHGGAKKGKGAYWGQKKDAKKDSNKLRRQDDKKSSVYEVTTAERKKIKDQIDALLKKRVQTAGHNRRARIQQQIDDLRDQLSEAFGKTADVFKRNVKDQNGKDLGHDAFELVTYTDSNFRTDQAIFKTHQGGKKLPQRVLVHQGHQGYIRGIWKRIKDEGDITVAGAWNSMKKESVEQIDELSVKTLSSYNRKASRDPNRAAGNNKAVGKIVRKTMRDVRNKKKESVEQIDELSFKTLKRARDAGYANDRPELVKKSLRGMDKKTDNLISKLSNKKIKKMSDRKFDKLLNKESVEQIDEGVIADNIVAFLNMLAPKKKPKHSQEQKVIQAIKDAMERDPEFDRIVRNGIDVKGEYGVKFKSGYKKKFEDYIKKTLPPEKAKELGFTEPNWVDNPNRGRYKWDWTWLKFVKDTNPTIKKGRKGSVGAAAKGMGDIAKRHAYKNRNEEFDQIDEGKLRSMSHDDFMKYGDKVGRSDKEWSDERKRRYRNDTARAGRERRKRESQKESVDEAVFDRKQKAFSPKVAFGDKGRKYQSDKAKQRSDMNKKNDPGAAKKGLTLSVIDRAKARKKAKEKGVDPGHISYKGVDRTKKESVEQIDESISKNVARLSGPVAQWAYSNANGDKTGARDANAEFWATLQKINPSVGGKVKDKDLTKQAWAKTDSIKKLQSGLAKFLGESVEQIDEGIILSLFGQDVEVYFQVELVNGQKGKGNISLRVAGYGGQEDKLAKKVNSEIHKRIEAKYGEKIKSLKITKVIGESVEQIDELTDKQKAEIAKRKAMRMKDKEAKSAKAAANKAKRDATKGTRGGEGAYDTEDSHVIMQLRKAQDVDGNFDITFHRGKTGRADIADIDAVLAFHDSIKPVDKRKLRIKLAKGGPEAIKNLANVYRKVRNNN